MGKMGELVLYVCMASLLVGLAKGQDGNNSTQPNQDSLTANATNDATNSSQPAITNQPALNTTSFNSSSTQTTSNNTSSNGTTELPSSSSPAISRHPDTASSAPPRLSTRAPPSHSTLSTRSATTTNTRHLSGVTNSSGHTRTTNIRPSVTTTPAGGTSLLLGSRNLLLVPAMFLLIRNM